jgi:hypothetical protein
MSAHTEQALAVARETGWDIDGFATDHEWRGVGIGPVGRHRDSDALARSNFEVVFEDLSTRFPSRVATVDFGHWGVGWVEEIAYDVGEDCDTDVVAAVQDWRDALADYPVASDEHYSELEMQETLETLRNCYRLEHDSMEEPFSWVLRPGLEDWASEMFGELSSSHPDDIPDESTLQRMAIDAGILVPDVETVREAISDVERERDRLADAIADYGRELITREELMEAMRDVSPVYVG